MAETPEPSGSDEVAGDEELPEIDEAALLRSSIAALEPTLLPDPPAPAGTPDVDVRPEPPTEPAPASPPGGHRRLLALTLIVVGVLVVAAGVVAAAIGH